MSNRYSPLLPLDSNTSNRPSSYQSTATAMTWRDLEEASDLESMSYDSSEESDDIATYDFRRSRLAQSYDDRRSRLAQSSYVIVKNADEETANCQEFLELTDSVDMDRVETAMDEAGSNARGIMGIDIWIFNDNDSKLYHFDRGINWLNPQFKIHLQTDARSSDSSAEKLETLDRLIDYTRPDFIQPVPEPSGVGFAGNYWQQFGDVAGSASYFSEPLVWRNMRAFTSDPDQMPVARMFALEKVFGKCTGVPFDIFGVAKGVVVFYARKTADESLINHPMNRDFLRLASYDIGSALAMSNARVRNVEERSRDSKRLFKKARMMFSVVKTLKTIGSQRHLVVDDITSDEDSPDMQTYKRQPHLRQTHTNIFGSMKTKAQAIAAFVKTKATSVKNKIIHPPAIKPPPPATLYVSTWSFVGCFSILLVLFGFTTLVKDLSDGSLGLILPPFGALMALQFSLTAAPASQPRNSLYGFFLAILVVMVNKILLHHLAGLPQWLHASLGTSLAIFSLQKCGLVHPPAGAAAFVFALSKKSIASDFMHAGVFLIADLIAILLAVFFNNLCATRQYPMYWTWQVGGASKVKKTRFE